MKKLTELLSGDEPANLALTERDAVAKTLSAASSLKVYPQSSCGGKGVLYAMGRSGIEKTVLRLSSANDGTAVKVGGKDMFMQKLPCNHETAVKLRAEASFLAPKLVGTATSGGCGDRLGIATPGHIQAIIGTGVVPYLAQQSIREMERTRRTPDQVMDCATFGVLEAGWVGGFGSDADHLKKPENVDYTMAAGFTMFTIDPGDHVDNDADKLPEADLRTKMSALPWDGLETSAKETLSRYSGKKIDVAGLDLTFSEEDILRAAVKYGKAVNHTVMMYRYIKGKGKPFELEMSVDETDSPTTTLEHYYFASELRRLGAEWIGLAPRFIGRFEKGVDYIGDIPAFEKAYIEHCKVAEAFGNYKLSIHSGSDKFSIYPICAKHAKGRVHLKTAGTSYLEALRTVACVNEPLFLEILAFAIGRYEEDKKSYHVSADLAKVIRPEACKHLNAPDILDQFDTRQAFHVTFGSVLTADDGKRFKTAIMQTLREHEEKHYEIIAKHMRKHFAPLAG
jgi:hypothetical protein